jgi:hypothetical protein
MSLISQVSYAFPDSNLCVLQLPTRRLTSHRHSSLLPANQSKMKFWHPTAWCLLLVLALTGCAFDLSYVNQTPAAFTMAAGPTNDDFILKESVDVRRGTGFPTHLKAGTRWHRVGQTQYGAVYSTTDQIVKVEASNIYEAQLVITNQTVQGFYLLVEKTFVQASHPISITIQPINN